MTCGLRGFCLRMLKITLKIQKNNNKNKSRRKERDRKQNRHTGDCPSCTANHKRQKKIYERVMAQPHSRPWYIIRGDRVVARSDLFLYTIISFSRSYSYLIFKYIIISLYHYIIISLYHYIIISLYHYIIISLYHYTIISSFHHFIISSFHHFIISSFHHFIILSLMLCYL